MPQTKIILRTGLISALLVIALSYFIVPMAIAKISFSEEERLFINKINDYRRDRGLKPLKISTKLCKSAQLMAQDMADNPDLINHQHTDSQGRSPSERAAIYGYTDGVGENLAAGYETAKKVYMAWKDSADHNANMIDQDYEVIGIALVTSNNNYKWYWVNTFGQEAHKNDLIKSQEYDVLKDLKITVTDENQKAIRKASVKIKSKGGSTLGKGKTNSKGKKTLTVNPKDEYYITASAKGYTSYTREITLGNKDSKSVKIWLEKK